ncbi:MAG: TonB-dependent receptor [Pseudomonadota bacterium]|nr:TonB-dependent receptor [Pseudomonadota bacterium]
MTLRARTPLSLTALALACSAQAQSTPPVPPSVGQLDTVVVTGQRIKEASFDVPAAISAVTRETIENAGPQVNLSEVLNRVPGISILNRNNYSQDLQLSIRGFGARSTFGIRGVKVLVDGIPASMPDGQGQVSNVALSSVGRIEVLRGPLAQLYGNAAGGVVQMFTEDDALVPTATVNATLGRYGLWKVGTKLSTSTPGYGLTIDASEFRTDGFRPHSEAERRQLNARWQSQLTDDTHMSVVLNALDQPISQDPLGLNATQFRSHQAGTNPFYVAALAQNPRKDVHQEQLGTVIEHRLNDRTDLTGRLYIGSRKLDSALSLPISAQGSPTSSGGIVAFDRTYGGGAGQIAHRVPLGDGRQLKLTAGVEVETLHEDRQGYVNTLGDRGALKRDEKNSVRSEDVYAQAAYDITSQWTVTAGARHSKVKFKSNDHYIAAGNPDDSGRLDFSATNPVFGVAWKVTPTFNTYANIGRGFETPTFNELSYRPNGLSGLNTGLSASRSRHAEVGAKWKYAGSQRLDVAVFDIETSDELVVDTNTGGRSTFKNAGRTSRRGIELSHIGQLSDTVRSTVSITALRARFDSDFISGTGTTPNVFSGNRLPGTPERNLFAELAWSPTNAWGGFSGAAEVVHTGKLYVNDTNTDAAPSSTVFNLRASFKQKFSGWEFSELIRVDNATNRYYAGSVIVNEGNSRFFETAMPRNWTLGVTAKYAL